MMWEHYKIMNWERHILRSLIDVSGDPGTMAHEANLKLIECMNVEAALLGAYIKLEVLAIAQNTPITRVDPSLIAGVSGVAKREVPKLFELFEKADLMRSEDKDEDYEGPVEAPEAHEEVDAIFWDVTGKLDPRDAGTLLGMLEKKYGFES